MWCQKSLGLNTARNFPYSSWLQCLGNSIVKKLIKLTVGEGEAWSDIAFRDSCMKGTNKEDSVGCETEPSHTHCPHASSGPPANLQYLPFRFLGNSWKASFLSCLFSLPLSLFLQLRLPEWKAYALWWSRSTPSGLQKMTLVWNDDLWPQNKTESIHRSASMRTQHRWVSAVICEDEGTTYTLVLCISKLVGFFIDLEG